MKHRLARFLIVMFGVISGPLGVSEAAGESFDLERLLNRPDVTKLAVCCWLILALLWPLPAAAAERFDSKLMRWLDEEDVRLVAVEFYSDYCEPCIEAVPRWERLKKRYEDQGLKFVVINVDSYDSDAQCKTLPWRPHVMTCAPELAEQVGVCNRGRCKVPQAFLWSWQGDMVVKGEGHIDAVEKAVTRYFDKTAPRFVVHALDSKGKPDPVLRGHFESEVGENGKIVIVSDEADRKRLEKLAKESYAPGRRDDQRCEIGQGLSANMRLRIQHLHQPGRTPMYALKVESIGKQCAATTVMADIDPKTSAEKNIRIAVKKLMSRLMKRPPVLPESMYGSRSRQSIDDDDVEEGSESTPYALDMDEEAEERVVSFLSQPPGATVKMNGIKTCAKKGSTTPCNELVEGKEVLLSMSMKDYVTRSEQVDLGKTEEVSWTLKPKFAELSVATSHPGVAIALSGVLLGQSPLSAHRVLVGKKGKNHVLEVKDQCYAGTRKERLKLTRGDQRTIELETVARLAKLQVITYGPDGELLRGATIQLDGDENTRPAGRVFKLPLCTQSVTVAHPQFGEVSRSLDLKEGKTLKLEVNFDSSLLNVTSPENYVSVTLDGNPIGQTPISNHQVAPGKYVVEVSDRCYHGGTRKTIWVEQGKPTNVHLTPRKRPGDCIKNGQVRLAQAQSGYRIQVGGASPVPATGVDVPVPALVPTRIKVYRDAAVPWTKQVRLKPNETQELMPTWARVELDGWKAGDAVYVGADKIDVRRGVFWVPDGHYEIKLQRKSAGWPPMKLKVEVRDNKSTKTQVPAVVRVRTDVSGLKLTGVGAKAWKVSRASGKRLPLKVVKPGQVLELSARIPERAPWSKTVELRPGDDITLDLRASAFPLTRAWETYFANNRIRKTSWIVAASGAGATVLGIILAQQSLSADAEAASLFEEYSNATDPIAGANIRVASEEADSRGTTLGKLSALSILLGAGSVGLGAWLIVKNPAIPEPNPSRSRMPEMEMPELGGWFDGRGGGVTLGVPLP